MNEMTSLRICPSILGYETDLKAHLGKLGDCESYKKIVQLVGAGAYALHIDVMSHPFIGNTERFSIELVRGLKEQLAKDKCDARLDVHLMVDDPSTWIAGLKGFLTHGDNITIHYEAAEFSENKEKIIGVVKEIKQNGFEAGVAINPETSLDELDELNLYDKINMLLLMSVVPGKGGQSFIDITYKSRRLRENYSGLQIQVDGGVKDSNILHCYESGITTFVVGSFITGAENPAEQLKKIKRKIVLKE